MTQQIQIARLNSILSRALSIAGSEAVAKDLSPEISAVLALEVDRPEWGYLSNTKLMSAGFGQALDAANPTFARIRNPAASGALAVVRVACSIPTAAAQTIRISIGTSAVDRANIKTTFPVDSRWQAGTGGALICSSDNTTFAGNTCALFDLATATLSIPRTFILAPGSHLDIGEGAVNVALNFTFDWSERAIEPYEVR